MLERKLILLLLLVLGPLLVLAQDPVKVEVLKDSSEYGAAEAQNLEAAQRAYNRGVDAFNSGDYKSAVTFFDSALYRKPDFEKALLNRAKAKVEQDLYDQAIKDLSDYIQLNDSSDVPFLLRARAYWSKKERQNAVKDYKAALERNSKNAEAAYHIGLVMFENDSTSAAIDHFDKAIAAKPDFALAYHDRGSAYRLKGDLINARADYEQAIRFDPELVSAYENLASVKREQENYDAALVDYQQALRMEPDNPRILNSKGYVHFLKEEYDVALENFEKALKHDPDYALAWNNKSGALFQKEKYRDAISAADKAIQLRKDYAQAYLNRGIAREMVRDIPGACEDWKRASELGVNSAQPYYDSICNY